jgi:hypothetical protein
MFIFLLKDLTMEHMVDTAPNERGIYAVSSFPKNNFPSLVVFPQKIDKIHTQEGGVGLRIALNTEAETLDLIENPHDPRAKHHNAFKHAVSALAISDSGDLVASACINSKSVVIHQLDLTITEETSGK